MRHHKTGEREMLSGLTRQWQQQHRLKSNERMSVNERRWFVDSFPLSDITTFKWRHIWTEPFFLRCKFGRCACVCECVWAASGGYCGTTLLRASPVREREREKCCRRKTTKPLPNLSSLALWEIISYRRNLENLTQSTLMFPPLTTSPVPTANSPICLRLQPKINSRAPPHPPCEHTHPSIALTHTHTHPPPALKVSPL